MLRAILVLGVLLALAPAAHAQLTGTNTWNVSIDSTYFDDCDPGTVCLVVWCGLIEGTFTMEYAGFDGVFDNYDVTDVSWDVHINLCPATPTSPVTPFTGTGTFQIDREPVPSQRMILDLTRPTGPAITIDSGFVKPAVPFPSFSGFELQSFPTAETFTLEAELVPGTDFVRGDANNDGGFDVADPIFILSTLFTPGTEPPDCLDSADVNDDGGNDISDAIFALSALFVFGSPPPPAPHPGCGTDPTDDTLNCGAYDHCP